MFIGVSANLERYRLLFAGVDVFDEEAGIVFDLIAKHDGGGKHAFDAASASSYVFPNQVVTLYDADTQYDRVRRRSGLTPLRRIWAQVGIGTKSYHEAIVGC